MFAGGTQPSLVSPEGHGHLATFSSADNNPLELVNLQEDDIKISVGKLDSEDAKPA